jgi:hypothetical protein
MAPNHRDDTYENAPEVAPQQHAYIYPVNEETAPYAVPPSKGYYQGTPVESQYAPVVASRGWKRWWILALIGLFIALIAGLVGGFIGQEIQKGRGSSDSAASSSPAPTNGNSSATTPPPNQPPGTVGTIVTPNTGCNFPQSKDRRRLTNTTVYTQTLYTTVCNSGWTSTGLVGLWTLTPDDCIESCVQYNKYAKGRPGSERVCVGGGFVPAWSNQTMASLIMNGAPFNCFLQANASGIIPNDREKAGIEVVALCLDGACPGAGTKS